ncbi:MAG: histidine phosphatase family protein [Chloroflexi bacterium]|nr:histidine phosphatase family protein [Chloroflexota bacterium]MBU1747463.1 histidine phosphatase family protein [Chloroflexota bacterium]
MRLYLIRHGESTWNAEGRFQGQKDPPLSERGQQQARRLAERLRPVPVGAMYASPQQRAWQTALHLADGRDVPLVPHDGLREVRVGIFEGLVWDEIQVRYPVEWERWQAESWHYTIPGAETQDEFQQRIWQAITEIVDRHPTEDVAVVAHGGVIGMYLNTLLGLDIWQWSPFRQGNTALNIIEVQNGHVRVVGVNDLCHLEDRAD